MKINHIIFILILVAGNAYPQNNAMTLEECLATAVQNNLGLKGARKEIEISEALSGTYLDIPNTGIELSQSSIEGAGMDNGLTFSQEFDFPTVYIARRKLYKAEERLVRAEYDRKVSELKGEIMSLYYSLLLQKSKLELLSQNQKSYSDFLRISLQRFEAGESSRLEYLNAERMRTKLETQIDDFQLSITALQLRLGKLIGIDTPVEIHDDKLNIIQLESDLMCFDAALTHNSKIMNAKIDINEKNVSLARQEFMPGLSVSATTQLVLKGFNPYHLDRERFTKGDFMGFSVGITVPLFFGSKRSKLIAAKRETEFARLQLEESMNVQSTEYEDLRNELELSRKRLDYYETVGVVQANEFLKLGNISYELGEIDYLEYMQNIETALEIQTEYLETIGKYNQSIIKLLILKGQL